MRRSRRIHNALEFLDHEHFNTQSNLTVLRNLSNYEYHKLILNISKNVSACFYITGTCIAITNFHALCHVFKEDSFSPKISKQYYYKIFQGLEVLTSDKN